MTLRVAEIWRYPVKSLQGERVDGTEMDGFGLTGDRRYAIIDLDTGLGLTGRRVGRADPWCSPRTVARGGAGAMHDELSRAQWKKSGYSGNSGNCVEVANLGSAVAVHDSKDPEGPVIIVTRNMWHVFVRNYERIHP